MREIDQNTASFIQELAVLQRRLFVVSKQGYILWIVTTTSKMMPYSSRKMEETNWLTMNPQYHDKSKPFIVFDVFDCIFSVFCT
jgi:hypothetical protein